MTTSEGGLQTLNCRGARWHWNVASSGTKPHVQLVLVVYSSVLVVERRDGRQTFTCLHLTCSAAARVTIYIGKPSAVGQL